MTPFIFILGIWGFLSKLQMIIFVGNWTRHETFHPKCVVPPKWGSLLNFDLKFPENLISLMGNKIKTATMKINLHSNKNRKFIINPVVQLAIFILFISAFIRLGNCFFFSILFWILFDLEFQLKWTHSHIISHRFF